MTLAAYTYCFMLTFINKPYIFMFYSNSTYKMYLSKISFWILSVRNIDFAIFCATCFKILCSLFTNKLDILGYK